MIKITKKVEREIEFDCLEWSPDLPKEIRWSADHDGYLQEDIPQKYVDMLIEIGTYLMENHNPDIEY